MITDHATKYINFGLVVDSTSCYSDCKDEEGRLSKMRIRNVCLNPFLLQCQRSKKCYNCLPSPLKESSRDNAIVQDLNFREINRHISRESHQIFPSAKPIISGMKGIRCRLLI